MTARRAAVAMQTKTPEQRREIAAKAQATRRARRESAEAARQEALHYSSDLRRQIAALEARLAALRHTETMSTASATMTGKALLSGREIALAALPWEAATGVYFLIEGDEVVYVGQSVNVYARIAQHAAKIFDRYAFIPCSVDALDRLESLYIHFLRPKLNADQGNGAKCAPISLDVLLGIAATPASAPDHPPSARSTRSPAGSRPCGR
jgi:hypothetical protein